MRAEYNRPVTFFLLVLFAAILCYDAFSTNEETLARNERIQETRFKGSISAR
jgi:hypothetical protein